MEKARSLKARFKLVFSVNGVSSWVILLVFSLALLLPFPTEILAADTTTPGQLSISSLNQKLKIIAPYIGDDNGNNTLIIEWDENGGDWGTLIGSVSLAHSVTPYNYTITGLTNGILYQVRLRWQDDNSPADQIQANLIPYNPFIHSSLSTASTKWGGAWGTSSGKYGEFNCLTCHGRNTPNIKRINGVIVTPDESNWAGPVTASIATIFSDNRESSSDFGDDSDGHTASDRICEVCHSLNSYHNYNVAYNVGGDTEHYNQSDCIRCHKHKDGFKHGGGSNCDACHGHDADYEYSPGNFSEGAGSAQSHSTHTENDLDDARGPNIACDSCHDISNFPYFLPLSGTDYDGDGKYNLAETDVCDSCHSPDGPLDGVADVVIGAKSNWSDGVYTSTDSSVLVAGKEQWCVGCHDSGTSDVGGRQAPDVAGNNSNYGYYQSGHGAFATECGACHGLAMDHNFDGIKTYVAASPQNYKEGYRLSDVGSADPLMIPKANDNCGYNKAEYRLCFSCHDEKRLIQTTSSAGSISGCANPYGNEASIITGFRNESTAGFGSNPVNIHWDHLVDMHAAWSADFWDSDGDGTMDSEASCTTCHNPHGAALTGTSTSTVRMTKPSLDIRLGSDANGDYGQIGPNVNYDCSVCHSNGEKYYRDTPPTLASITLADNNSSDPIAAKAGYTNSQSVTVTISIIGSGPSDMQFAEDIDFSSNATSWVTYNSTYTYTLSAGDGTRTVYGRLKNGNSQSASQIATIVLDTVAPSLSGSALIAPNGSETWIQNASANITWIPEEITDANLEASPISLAYSTNSGSSFLNEIVRDEANDGIYPWRVAAEESSAVQVRLTATDMAGNQGFDSSDADFTIASVMPVLASITLTDNNSFDPAGAEAGYTNNQSIAVTLSVSNNPTQMMLAEDSGFSVNATGWIAFNSNYNYSLTAGDGSRTVYARVKNGAGESGDQSNTIILDTIAPDIQAGTLASPNGHATRWLAEFWQKGSAETISWTSGDITDINLKDNPIYLRYSTNSGTVWPATIASDEANDGDYDWAINVETTHYARIRLAAQDKAGNEGTDDSDHDFNISPPYIVTNTNDSGVGSLRQTILDSQAGGGHSAIWFNIPDNDPGFANGVAVINPATETPWLIAATTLDGSSQTILRGDTNPNGPEIRMHKITGSSNNGIGISGNSITVKSMQFTGFYAGIINVGEDATIESCQFGFYSDSAGYGVGANTTDLDLDNRSVVSDGNYFACSAYGITLAGSDSEITGSTFGRFPDGTVCAHSTAIYLNGLAMNNQILNNSLISTSAGILLAGAAGDTTIRGNQIGVVYENGSWVDVSGPMYGIRVDTGGKGHLFGGPLVASSDENLRDSNVIGASSYGLFIENVQDNSTNIYGNFIGTNPEQDEVFTGNVGLWIGVFNGLRVGGSGPGEAGNVFANMNQYGITFEGTGNWSDYHEFSRNSFYNNGDDSADDAIYLSTDGNAAISRPVIDSVTTTTLSTSNLYGGFSVNSGDIVEVFIADFGGTEYGEGKTFLASAVVPFGETTLAVDISEANLNAGDWVTITTTSQIKGTSAFSTNMRIAGPAVPTIAWTGENNYTVDGVNPDSDVQLSNFTFRVKYTDADNDSPWPVEVWIDADDNGTYAADERFAMIATDGGDADYTDGKLYIYSMVLSYVGDGILKYRFNASDGQSTATGDPVADNTLEIINAPPDTPSNDNPANGAIDVLQPPTFTASAFTNTAADAAAGDTHQASQWLISSASGVNFTVNQIYDSGAVAATNSHAASISWVPGTTYYWKVRYQDNHGEWSAYSANFGFTTLANNIPDQPINVTPAEGAVAVDLQPLLSASTFSDADSDAHQASLWQVSTANGARFDAAIAYDSGAIAATTSHTVTTPLSMNNKYYWRVSYQDSKGQWSAYSSATGFFVPTSLVSMFHFDEGSGVIAYDSYGNNDGSVQPSATWTTGFLGGQSLMYDEVNDYVTWSYAEGTPANNFTIEAMVKATTTHQIDLESISGTDGISGQNYLFGATYYGGTNAGAGISMGTNGISVYEHSDGYMPPLAVYDSTEQLGTDWSHVVVSYTDKRPRIYLNGQLVHTGLTSPKTNVFAPTRLASGSYGTFAGTIDEVAIYGTALTKAEIMQHCIAVGQCPSADLDSDGVIDSSDNCMFEYNPDQADLDADGVGNVCDYLSYWKMDDGSGSIAEDEAQNSNITLSGGTAWSTGVNGSGGLVFDGANVAARAENILDNYNGDFSISVWLKFPTGAINPKWSLGKGFDPYRSLGIGIGHWVTANEPVAPSLIINDGTQGAFLDPEWEWPHRIGLPSSSIPRGTWGHFVWTIDRTNNVMKVYKNGQYDGERDLSILGTNALTDDKLFNLGRAGDSASMYTGSMDNVTIYDFVLQPGDVQARCEADAGVGNCP